MGLPYMPLYAADYLGDTMHLTLEQHGAYIKLLMCMWRAGGELPFDHPTIARMLAITPKKWAAIRGPVMAFFEHDEASFWNSRLREELAKTTEMVRPKRAAGEAGARSKVLKTLESGSAISEPDSESDSDSNQDLFGDAPRVPAAPAMTLTEAAAAIWNEAPKTARKRSSIGQLHTALEGAAKRGKNLAAIRRAVESHYADPDVVKENFRFARGVHRVVQNDFWETWAVAEGVEQLPADGMLDRQHRFWMEEWMKDPGKWRPERGFEPDHPRCAIPLRIMQEFGYTPPVRDAR